MQLGSKITICNIAQAIIQSDDINTSVKKQNSASWVHVA